MMPDHYEPPTDRRGLAMAAVWISAAVVTLAGRTLAGRARWLYRHNRAWWTGTGTRWKTVAFVASWLIAGWWLGGRVSPQLVSAPYTLGAEHVEAASERFGTAEQLPADARYTRADVMATAAAVVALNAPSGAAQDDPMVPLVPMLEYAAPGGPDDGTPPAWLPDGLAPWWLDIVAAAHENGLDSHAFGAIVAQENPWGNPAAASPAGASGLAQLMGATARDIEAQTGIDTSTPDGNLRGGAWYYAQRVRDYADLWTPGNDEATLLAAAAAYNGGALPAEDVRTAAKAGAADVCAGVRYAETRVYCQAFRDRWRQTLAARGGVTQEAMR